MMRDIEKLSIQDIKDIVNGLHPEEYIEFAENILKDRRNAVQKIASQLYKNHDKYRHEVIRIEKMTEFEKHLYHQGAQYIAGIDEVGRGPLAGPVVTAAVILPRDFFVLGINDSKKLSEKKRDELYDYIKKNAIDIGIGIIDNTIIDRINILNATKLAMKTALSHLKTIPDHVLIDALRLEDIQIPQTGIIKGDEKSISIAAASIIAKVTRDKMMTEYHQEYPWYNFESNKGYGTRDHYQGLEANGLCKIHRRSFLKNL